MLHPTIKLFLCWWMLTPSSEPAISSLIIAQLFYECPLNCQFKFGKNIESSAKKLNVTESSKKAIFVVALDTITHTRFPIHIFFWWNKRLPDCFIKLKMSTCNHSMCLTLFARILPWCTQLISTYNTIANSKFCIFYFCIGPGHQVHLVHLHEFNENYDGTLVCFYHD